MCRGPRPSYGANNENQNHPTRNDSLVVFALSPITHAVSPPPDGGYPGGNTAEGQQALFSVTTGTYNTAVGFLSLRNNTEGQFNTAIGARRAPCQHRGTQYRDWCWSAFKQHHRQLQHGQRRVCPLFQQRRPVPRKGSF